MAASDTGVQSGSAAGPLWLSGIPEAPLHWALRALVILLILLSLGLGVERFRGFLVQEMELPPTVINALGGQSYFAPLEHFKPRGPFAVAYDRMPDSPSQSSASTLALLENGRPLALPHSVHKSIADLAGGRYSHWGDNILFSSSDGTDPRTNGRRYSLAWSPNLLAVLVPPAVLIGLLLLPGKHRRMPEFRATAAVLRIGSGIWFAPTLLLAIYVVAVFGFMTPPIPKIFYDSTSYWIADVSVPLGYPAFLHGIYWLSGSLRTIILVQVAIYCAAVLLLQYGVLLLTASEFLSAVVAMALLTYAGQFDSADALTTEQLFTAFLVLHAAAAAWAVARPSRTALASLALTAVLCVTVRPAGYFLYGGVLFLFLIWRGRRLQVLRWGLIPLVAFTAVYMGIGHLMRGTTTQSITGLALFPHVMHLYDGGPRTISPEAAQAVIEVIKPYKEARALAADAESRYTLEGNNFNDMLRKIIDALNQHGELTPAKAVSPNAAVFGLALQAIAAHPLGYATVVGENFYTAGRLFALSSYPRSGAQMRLYYESFPEAKKMLLERSGARTDFDIARDVGKYDVFSSGYRVPQFGFYNWRKYALALFLMIALIVFSRVIIGVLIAPTEIHPKTIFIAYTLALGLGGLLLAALSTVVLNRYVVPLDTYVLISICVGLHRGWQMAVHYCQAALAPPYGAR
jgi:hypothetical protein